jgi:monovalent cation:H+ antiporter-2, CPA2 family
VKELLLLRDLVVLLGMTIPVVLICHRLKIPSILGFLLTGVVLGPHGFKLIIAHENIQNFAEFGIVALLFTIGLEFSMQKIWSIKRIFFAGGFLQVSLTIAASTLIAMSFGMPLNKALFAGFLVSLSSTAMVLSILQEKSSVQSPHGRLSLAILIFQDISIVVMILMLPLLSGRGDGQSPNLPVLLMRLIIAAILVYVGTRWLIPFILHRVAKTGSRQLFLFAILFLCLSIGYLTSSLGLSLALGAFLAGLMISESDYSHRALGSVVPLKDVFSSLFFISMGMLFDIHDFLGKPFTIVIAALAIMLIKGSIGAITALMLRRPISTAILAGASISQIGEFSFILYQTGSILGLVENSISQGFLGVSLCTMFLTPLVMQLSPLLSKLVARLPFPARWRGTLYDTELSEEHITLKDHLLIIGFGLVGKSLAAACSNGNIPYAVIELNPDTITVERKKGEPVYYGDATHEAALRHLHIETARVVVIAVSDPSATFAITELARRLNAHSDIIARTRFLADVDDLLRLGASSVITEELETAMEIFRRVQTRFSISIENSESLVRRVQVVNN